MILGLPITIDHGLALIRVVVGLLLAGHGAQKLFGWFGGHGIGAVAGWLSSLGVRAAPLFAWIVGLAEFAGGLAFALGLLTPFAALALSLSMLGAIALVHWSKGLWVTNGGFEYPLVILATAFAIGMAGPGALALDTVLGIRLPGAQVYLAGLLVELVGLAALLLARPRVTEQTVATAS